MKSPITGKDMVEASEDHTTYHKGVDVTCKFTQWRCMESGEEFTDSRQMQKNLEAVKEAYKEKARSAVPRANTKTNTIMSNKANKQKKIFDAGSPGFLYTVIVSLLAILAWSGVELPSKPVELANEITTALSTSGFFAIVGIIVSSVAFPVWNAWKKGALTFDGVFSSTLTWIALGNILFAGLALTGFVLPDGTVEQIVYAVEAKDWAAIISMLVTTIIPAIVRLIKDRKTATT